MNLSNSSNLLLVVVSTIVILTTVVLTSGVTNQSESAFSQIIVTGPIWSEDTWTCTSDADFLVHGTLRGLEDSMIAINIDGVGTQSLYTLNPGELESFSIGGQADNIINITRTGTVTGFLTLQTTSDAIANCLQ